MHHPDQLLLIHFCSKANRYKVSKQEEEEEEEEQQQQQLLHS